MIRCVHCGGLSKTVYSVRTSEGVERRRECTNCGRRFLTMERYERDIKSIKNYQADMKGEANNG